MRIAHRIHSIPLTLMALTGLAQLEARLDPDLTTEWLTFILNHPAATPETKERARQLISDMEKHSGIKQVGVSQE